MGRETGELDAFLWTSRLPKLSTEWFAADSNRAGPRSTRTAVLVRGSLRRYLNSWRHLKQWMLPSGASRLVK